MSDTMMNIGICFLFLLPLATCLTCHQCAGASTLTQTAANAFADLNITQDFVKTYGDCSATSGVDTCSNGTYCFKNAVVYKIGVSVASYSWNTFTKGCTSVRLDNGATPSNKCFDITSSGQLGYTQTTRQCYCQGNLCNFSPSFSIVLRSILSLLIFVSLY